MAPLLLLLLLIPVPAALATPPSLAAAGLAAAPGSSPPLVVEYRDGRLTVQAREHPLRAVLAEIGRKAGITFHVRKSLSEEPVTLSLEDLPAERLLRRLLRLRFDLVWAFDRPAGGGPMRVAEVWVLPKGSRAAGVARRGPGSTEAEKQAALEKRLDDILELEDEDPARALPLLIGALNDPDPRIRSVAAEVLGELGDVAAVEPLGHALRTDPDVEVRDVAAEALGVVGSPEAVPALRQALGDRDEEVRETVLYALLEIGGLEAERAIWQALADQDEEVREAAEDALAELRRQRPPQ